MWGRWIGAGFGWALGVGPITHILGALGGYGLGNVLDELREERGGRLLRGGIDWPWNKKSGDGVTTENDFILSSILLTAAVLKADGKTDPREMAFIRVFMADQFGAERAGDFSFILEAAIKSDYDPADVCKQVVDNTTYEIRLVMLQFLFGVANADFSISDAEAELIQKISDRLKIETEDYLSIKAMYKVEVDSAFRILEITPSASDAEIKAAYRNMTLKYHPDKVAHLGEAAQRAAHEKFQKLNEAYNQLKKQRGFS